MEYDVRLEQVESRPLAVVRRRASLPELAQVIPAACGKVWDVARAQGVPGAGRHIALYWDDVINLEVGVELEAPFAGHDEVVASATPGGLVATAVHFGPYNRLPEAHHAIRRWCANHGFALAGPNWEIYGHWIHEWCDDPSKIRTDVFYLLKAAQLPAGTLGTLTDRTQNRLGSTE
jgi:effector-binding domain-containing protein